MPDQPEPKGLTAEELDLLQRQAELNDGIRTSVWARSQLLPLVAMARLSLTLQRRAEAAEAMARALAGRLEAAELVLDLVHEIRDGGGALEPQLREHFDRWLEAESKRVGEAFANLRSRKQ